MSRLKKLASQLGKKVSSFGTHMPHVAATLVKERRTKNSKKEMKKLYPG